LYKVNIETKEFTKITSGQHDYTEFALAGSTLIGTKMNHQTPTEIFKVEENGTEKQLSFTNKELLDKITPSKSVERWVKTTDGKMMLVWIVYPPNFDSTKTYPALLYCQGGPQSAVSQFYSYRWNLNLMSSNGYIVIAPNRRGLPTFGQEWNDQISLDYGGQNMKDYLSAVDDMKKQPYVGKIGAIGASYGGYSVYWLAGNHNKRFNAFVAHNGIFNFESMYGSTEESFFVNHDIGGPYWKTPRPKSYDYSPHNFVGKWDTPIMVITGEKDFRIPYTEGMQAFNAAQLQGIPSTYLHFPGETHFVLKPQNSVLWQREVKKFLDQHLK
jgi:dipeptidyl aminopeptidase/acylaminoacyl peptidase